MKRAVWALFAACLVSTMAAAAGWVCKGEQQMYPHWVTNTERSEGADVVGWTSIRGDQDSADFVAVCHKENGNPGDPEWDAKGICTYYGPVDYDYAYSHVNYYVNKGYGWEYDHDHTAYVYCQ